MYPETLETQPSLGEAFDDIVLGTVPPVDEYRCRASSTSLK